MLGIKSFTRGTTKFEAAEAPQQINRVQLLGRLVADPDVRYYGEGGTVARFRLATNVDGQAEFHNCVAFRKAASLVEKADGKGQVVLVGGRLHRRSWKTPEGQTRTSVEIIVE
jgi:single-strand DNA-binding protein